MAGNWEVGEGYAAGKLSISMGLMSCVDKKSLLSLSINPIHSSSYNSIIHPAHFKHCYNLQYYSIASRTSSEMPVIQLFSEQPPGCLC